MTDARWYSVDHYKSDIRRHNYCGTCYDQIPDFLVRHANEVHPTLKNFLHPLTCEGCGRMSSQTVSAPEPGNAGES